MKYRQYILSFLLYSFIPFCAGTAQQGGTAPAIIAKAGDVAISEREFVSRFEMLPGFGRHRRAELEAFKEEFLYTLIAEKLLAQEAINRKLDKDSVFEQALMVIRKKLSRDELYRIEISQKVKITDLELIRGMARVQNIILAEYLYFPDEQDALFVRRLLNKKSDFESLKIDTSITYVRDTASVIWGDADPVLEDAVYRLKPGKISDVIKAGPGYYIARVAGTQKNSFYATMEQRSLRDHVVDLIRLRKERERLDEYIGEVMKDKRGYSIPKTFLLFARTLKEVYFDPSQKYDGIFSQEVMEQVMRRCRASLNDSLTVVGNSYWSLRDVIGKLTNKYAPIEREDSLSVPALLNTQIMILVQQELLEQEALQRGLDQAPSVQEALAMWRDATLAGQMKDDIRKKTGVTDAEIVSFLNQVGKNEHLPRVQVRLLTTESPDEMNSAMQQIRNGGSFTDAVKRWSLDTLTKANGGLTDYFLISEHPPIGELAWRMEPGETYGPIMMDGKYILFRLEAKDSLATFADSAMSARFTDAGPKVSSLKAKRTLNLFLAQLGKNNGFTIFEDRLKQVKVTPIPMMTFKILGFGGRMFAVPFADPQLEWLNVEPPAETVFP
ncbi:MAG: peptidyl-prolyl cis-trans isomerase [Bacteroidota bacterium]